MLTQELKARIAQADREITGWLAVYNENKNKLIKSENKLKELSEQKEELEELNKYFTKLIADRREGIISKVLAFVTDGMQIIFDDPSIHVLLEDIVRSGKKYTRIGISVNGIETWDWSAASGGIRQAVSFLFRVIFLSMSSNRRFMVLDEPFSALSAQYRQNIASLIKTLADDMNMQFFIVTHQDEIRDAATNLFEITQGQDGEALLVQK